MNSKNIEDRFDEQERTNSGNGRKIKMITIRRAQETGLGSMQKVIETAFSDYQRRIGFSLSNKKKIPLGLFSIFLQKYHRPIINTQESQSPSQRDVQSPSFQY